MSKRTTFFLLGMLMLCNSLLAQQKININIKNASLETIIKELRKQTGREFVYTDQQAKALSPISINLTASTLDQVMQILLRNTDYTYENSKGAILIIERKRDSPKQVVKEKRIIGIIKDDQGKGIPSVSVRVAGFDQLTHTRADGTFDISVPLSATTLEVTSIGYVSQKLKISDQTSISLILKRAENKLDEAIVIAYGTTTKREQTGAISEIKGKEIADIPAANIGNLLQGRVAGMDVTNMSGSPGSGGTAIVIRGYNSLDVEQERRYSSPLWIVDGVPMNTFTSPITGTNLLSDLNPDMIESIQVLKDASAAAIYGSRAANGVIMVTTKKGKVGEKATFAVNASQTIAILPRLHTITTGNMERRLRLHGIRNSKSPYPDLNRMIHVFPKDTREIYNNGGQGSVDANWIPFPTDFQSNGGGVYQDSLNSFFNNSTNFLPLMFEAARVTNANLQSYGGTQTINYGVGLGYYNENGIAKGTGFNRVDFNTRLNANPISKITINSQINASTGSRKRGTPSQTSGLKSAPLIETIPGDPLAMTSLYPGEESPIWAEYRKKQEGTNEKNRSFRLRGALRVGYNILPNLNFSTSGSIDYSLERRNFFTPSYLDITLKNRNQSLGEQGINLMALNENLLTYKTSIDEHNFTVLLGQSLQYEQYEYNGGWAKSTPSDLVWFASPALPPFTKEKNGNSESIIPLQKYMSDMWEKKLLSYFGRIEYNFKKRYLLSLALRKDGSSVFGDKNKWATFPSIGAGYNFSEDLNWKPLSFGKARASWGRSGLQFYNPYLALGTLDVGFAFQGYGTLKENILYNQRLSWEETDQFDIGLDLEFWNSKLSIVTDYYYRKTDKLLDWVPLAAGYNMYSRQWQNAGAISNEGLELLIKYEAIRTNNLYWKVTFNTARNWNKFIKSYGNYAESIYNSGRDIARILGKPLNGIMAIKTDGFYNSQEEIPIYYDLNTQGGYFGGGRASYHAGNWKVLDIDGDGKVSTGDYTYIGSALPILSGGLGSEVRYKNFDFNILFSYQFGRHILNQLPGYTLATGPEDLLQHPLLIDINKVKFWTPGDSNANFPVYTFENLVAGKPSFTLDVDRYVQCVNWMKLKTLVMGYNFKFKKGYPEQLRLFASAENLFTLTNYDGIDPEVVDLQTGTDQGLNYPLARKITLGLTLKF